MDRYRARFKQMFRNGYTQFRRCQTHRYNARVSLFMRVVLVAVHIGCTAASDTTDAPYQAAPSPGQSTTQTLSETVRLAHKVNYMEEKTLRLDSPGICGKTFATASATVWSHLTQDTYPHNVNCSVTIHIPEGYFAAINLQHIDLVRHQDDCTGDWLSIYDVSNMASPLGTYCGLNDSPVHLSTETDVVLLRFVTDSANSSTGFTVRVTSFRKHVACLEEEDLELKCDDKCLPKRYQCDGTKDCSDGKDETRPLGSCSRAKNQAYLAVVMPPIFVAVILVLCYIAYTIHRAHVRGHVTTHARDLWRYIRSPDRWYFKTTRVEVVPITSMDSLNEHIDQ